MPLLSPEINLPMAVVEEILQPEVVENEEKSSKQTSKREQIAAIYARKGLTLEAIAEKSAHIFLYGEDQHLTMKIAEKVLSLNGAGEEDNVQKVVPQINISFGQQSIGYSHKLMEVLIPNE